MNELLLFASCFMSVFALGFQSQNVNQGHYVAAFLTSFLIGAGHLMLYRLIPEAGFSEVAAYMLGGPFGITVSMYVHRRWMQKSLQSTTKDHHERYPV